MASDALDLFNKMVDELDGYDQPYHKCFPVKPYLNGIIRNKHQGYTGVILKYDVIYQFSFTRPGVLTMQISRAAHPIMVRTKMSLVLLTENGAINPHPVFMRVTRDISDAPFWSNLINQHFRHIKVEG